MPGRKKIYIFPLTTNKKPFNSYVVYLAESLSQHFDIVNKDQKKNIGVFDFIKYSNADIFVLNWPENIYKLKFGYFQFFLFSLVSLILKCFKKKFIWILHNKYPHTGKDNFAAFAMKFVSLISNLAITHSKSGVSFYEEKFKGKKVAYLPHPVYPDAQFEQKPLVYDIIIWGKIAPYKNIHNFLPFVKNSSILNTKKILICGSCDDPAYDAQIRSVLTDNVTFLNKYLSAEELNDYISQSDTILFTYDSESILSSGALIFSLPSYKRIIGPNLGSFADYRELNLIYTYNTFADIPALLSNPKPNERLLQNYLTANTWDGFSKHFLALSKLL